MEKIGRQVFLYDFYGELLTKHQQEIYEDFVLNDLSLSEIASEFGISRQGVHDTIKRCDRILAEYEEKLQLVERFLKTREAVLKILELSKCLSGDYKADLVRISKMAETLLDEL